MNPSGLRRVSRRPQERLVRNRRPHRAEESGLALIVLIARLGKWADRVAANSPVVSETRAARKGLGAFSRLDFELEDHFARVTAFVKAGNCTSPINGVAAATTLLGHY